jgi:hypothetical protein
MTQLRSNLLAATLVFAMGVLASPARADILTVSGSTTGTFSPTLSHLSFTGASFGPTTSDTLTLGSFNLDNGSFTYNGTFDLTVTFTAPPGTSGSPIVGNLSGSVTGNSGSVTVTFTNPTLFTFPGGSFDLSANTVTANLDSNGGVSTLTGILSNETRTSTVPEPASFLLFGTLAATLGFARRKHLI